MAKAKKTPKIHYAKRLTHEAISDLLRKKHMAICIRKYYEPKLAKEIANEFCRSSLFGKYKNAPIYRAGRAYFEGYSSKKQAEKYRRYSTSWIRRIRKEGGPYLLPVDRFRLELDEAWHFGAHLGNLLEPTRIKAFAGLVRVFNKGSGTEIHQDKLDWDLKAIDGGETQVMSQLAVNIYLDMPKQGGQVRLWRESLNKKEYDYLRNKDSYGVDELKLPKPDFVFRPKAGDLWLFRASELHQVVESGAGRRVTQSCFVGFWGDNEHLIVWS